VKLIVKVAASSLDVGVARNCAAAEKPVRFTALPLFFRSS